MQAHGELDVPTGRADTTGTSSRKRKSVPRRKVTIRLSEKLHQRLETATVRPGVGKSMVVETALEQFLEPVPSAENPAQTHFDDLHLRFDRLERDMRMMAETIALHARYHLPVMPPLPHARQQEAILLGDERFRILAEQVERRVRLGRPLMQETIDRLKSADRPGRESARRENRAHSEGDCNKTAVSDDADQALSPATRQDNSNLQAVNAAAHSALRRDHAGSTELDPGPDPCDFNSELSEQSEGSQRRQLSKRRLVLSVFLPFSAGYYLAYLFRTINGSISPALASTFGLDAADTGLLASVYFLVFGLVQIPLGALLDRFGPRRVQGVLLVIAAGGATLFGTASSFPELLVGRAMIGLGVAGALTASLKAIVTWFPKERVALLNGWMIMLGSLGAVTATAPTEWLLELVGWRDLFEILTIATVMVGGLIYMVVPEGAAALETTASDHKPPTLRSILLDPRFLRVAPLSAACIGSSWALHSLWASAWLADVEGLDHQNRASQLFFMAVGLSLGALLLGTVADRLRKRNVSPEALLAGVAALFMAAELALVLRLPLPSLLPWSVVSVAGAATVLSFAVIADYFPREIAARANGALNLLHFGWAFAVQYGIGFVVGQWPALDGHYPTAAYQYAFGLSLVFQSAALVWFAMPWLGNLVGHLYRSVVRPTAERDDPVSQVQLPGNGPILEAHGPMEW